MSAPKSKVRQQKMMRKRQRKEMAKHKRRQNRDYGFADLDIIEPNFGSGPVGGVKMSEVLEEFIDPLADGIEDLDQYRALLALGQGAWNAALCPESERETMVNKTAAAFFSIFNPTDRTRAKELLGALIERKLQHFAAYRRPILAFDVQDTGDGWHLQVASAVV